MQHFFKRSGGGFSRLCCPVQMVSPCAKLGGGLLTKSQARRPQREVRPKAEYVAPSNARSFFLTNNPVLEFPQFPSVPPDRKIGRIYTRRMQPWPLRRAE